MPSIIWEYKLQAPEVVLPHAGQNKPGIQREPTTKPFLDPTLEPTEQVSIISMVTVKPNQTKFSQYNRKRGVL